METGILIIIIAVALKPSELDHFLDEYDATEFSHIRGSAAKPTKPIEVRVPPDLLWLLHRSGRNARGGGFERDVSYAMHKTTEKGAKGYTKLVTALIDRCFASDKANFHYGSILDVHDPVLLKQYRIDTPFR
ncbi:MAG: hypothetical protein LBO00_05580 [Zoogloeaceae bacterium]|jgi:hypothetical protein|nr:hypothetical protein [Zoogloeaceae bacterium]